MEVNLDNGTDRINISGTTAVVPVYHGKKVQTTHGGKTKIRWTTKIHEVSINIEYLPSEDYKNFLKIIESVKPIMLTTEDSEIYRVNFTDERLNLQKNKNAEGEIYWTGTVNFKE